MIIRCNAGHSTVDSLVTLAVLILLLPLSIVFSQSNSVNWLATNAHTEMNWNYIEQDQINAQNSKALVIKWFFPISLAPTPILLSGRGSNGVTAPILIVDGIAYTVTNFHKIIAIDAHNGKFLWQTDLPLSVINESTGKGYLSWQYTTNVLGVPLIWLAPDSYHVIAINALNGDIVFSMRAVESDDSIEGNYGTYVNTTGHFVIDEKRHILIIGTGSRGTSDDGRGFIRAISLNSTAPRILWTTFIMPPQDGSDPSWSFDAVNSMRNAWIFDGQQVLDLKRLDRNELQAVLYGDWGKLGFDGKRSHAGTGFAGGGSWAIDEEDGIVYVGTAAPSPQWNATDRPGPNLWSSSILAIDIRTGKIIWGFQASTHDLWGFDCSWNVVLTDLTIDGYTGKAIIKACKNGFVYALDALTGELLWTFRNPNLPSIKCSDGSVISNLNDPLNPDDLRKPWACFPTANQFTQSPASEKVIDNGLAYDPTIRMVFAASVATSQTYQVAPTSLQGKNCDCSSGALSISNISLSSSSTTLYAINASNGNVKWQFVLNKMIATGGTTVTGGTVFLPVINGTIFSLDENTGALVGSKYIAGPISVRPSVGSDVYGNVLLLFPSSSVLTNIEPEVPGYVLALGLPQQGSAIQTTTLVPEERNYLPYLVLSVIVTIGVVIVLGIAVGRRRKMRHWI